MQSEPKHTPQVVFGNASTGRYDIHENRDYSRGGYLGSATNLDVANLWAAAPDLLAACKRCIAALSANGAPNCEAAKEARAAIAKALGND